MSLHGLYKVSLHLICTHFNTQLKEIVISAMKSKLIKMAFEAFPKLTSTFKLRASQPALPGDEMSWLRACLHPLTGAG